VTRGNFLKISLKRIALVILSIIGYVLCVPLWLGRRKNKIVILRYHSVSDFRRHEVNVKRGAFRRQMKFLSRNYKPIGLGEALALLKHRKNIPEKSIVVTFDDGYKDNYRNAYPILKELKIPVTIFLTAGYIGTDKILSHDSADCPEYNFLLSWDEARIMQQGGVEFGSHTLHHANLGKGDSDLNSEVGDSKEIIEKQLGVKVRSISFPFGLCRDFDATVKRLAQEAGYECGCSAMNGVNGYASDIFELRRIGVEASDTMFTFRAKLNGVLDLLVMKDAPLCNRILNALNRLVGV